MDDPFGGRTPDIDYPCAWSYRLIGAEEERMRIAVGEILEGVDHVVERSNVSSSGRYVALRLTLRVRDEEQRRELFRLLGARSEFTYVM